MLWSTEVQKRKSMKLSIQKRGPPQGKTTEPYRKAPKAKPKTRLVQMFTKG